MNLLSKSAEYELKNSPNNLPGGNSQLAVPPYLAGNKD